MTVLKNWMATLKKVASAAADNVGFLIGALACVILVLALAFFAEKLITAAREKKGEKTSENERQSLKIRRMTLIAMMTALATVLMLFDFPIPGLPAFYQLDFSEIPIIIGAYAMGPVAGVLMEFLKILLNLLFNGTSTVFIGEFANFIMGCCYVVPAAILYYARTTKRMARISLAAGTLTAVVSSCLLNAYLLLPTYGKLFHMDVVKTAAKDNSGITTIGKLIIFGTLPFNLLKYGVVSIITLLIYKHISRLLREHK
ncbi:MAG: ECF transporter S component [Lachnospiraceae bacterium]|nr:ECF transporter S component [Lachnospiraceae bacterium]